MWPLLMTGLSSVPIRLNEKNELNGNMSNWGWMSPEVYITHNDITPKSFQSIAT